MNRPSHIAAGVAIIFGVIIFAPLALAQALPATDTSVDLDVGRYIEVVFSLLGVFALGVFAWVKSKLPKKIAIFLEQKQINELLEKALGYGAAVTKGAGFLKPVKIDVGNPWIAASIEGFLNERAPDFMEEYGRAAVEKMLLARIPLAQDEAVKPAAMTSIAAD